MAQEKREKVKSVASETMGKSNAEHPDYGKMVGEVPDILRPLLNTGDDTDGLPGVDDIMTSCLQLDRCTLAPRILPEGSGFQSSEQNE